MIFPYSQTQHLAKIKNLIDSIFKHPLNRQYLLQSIKVLSLFADVFCCLSSCRKIAREYNKEIKDSRISCIYRRTRVVALTMAFKLILIIALTCLCVNAKTSCMFVMFCLLTYKSIP